MRAAGLAVVVAMIGAAVLLHADGARASRFKVFTVEVSEAGFNPPVCQISRDNYVQFKNMGRGPIRVIRHGSGDALTFDSGPLKPGGLSTQDFFPHGGTATFHDAARPDHFLSVLLPVWSPEWDEFCDPKPELRPAPRFDCTASANCAVLPALARDR